MVEDVLGVSGGIDLVKGLDLTKSSGRSKIPSDSRRFRLTFAPITAAALNVRLAAGSRPVDPARRPGGPARWRAC